MPSNAQATPDPQAAKKKKQLIIVALLAAGLLIAIVTQPSDGKTESLSHSKSPALKATPPAAAKEKEEIPEKVTKVRELAREELESILQAKMFVLPEPEPEVQQEETPQVLVKAIYGAKDRNENAPSTNHRILIGEEIFSADVIRVTSDGVEVAQ